jgi:hypothetical protein
MTTPAERYAVLEAVTERAERHSISLTAPELIDSPLTRADRESIFTIHNGEIYTSPVILGAEAVLLVSPATPPGQPSTKTISRPPASAPTRRER